MKYTLGFFSKESKFLENEVQNKCFLKVAEKLVPFKNSTKL